MANNNGVMIQYFQWYLESSPHLWNVLKDNAKDLAAVGFSAVWMPPAYKGAGGVYDTGYGVYDLYDLGEFDQKGSVETKYGTKDEYLSCIQELHRYHLDCYGDIVLNHKMGADETEDIQAFEVNDQNTNDKTSGEETIKAYTKFTFPGRKGKYSSFQWNWKNFDGVDYDEFTKNHHKYLFESKNWNNGVDDENGNFDYLMGADLDFSNEDTIQECKDWGKWYLDTTGIDGLRLDAVKHISSSFYADYLPYLRQYSNSELFTVGEYWHGDLQHLLNYLNNVKYEMSLFDVCLHYHFYDACHSNGSYNMSKILDNTLVSSNPECAVTFVDNHDTQPSQGLQSWIDDWFKPLAYALILLRKDGYPCVFYGDYYGIKHDQVSSKKDMLDTLLQLRKDYNHGDQIDYFDHESIIGWIRDNDHQPMVVIMSDSIGGNKMMNVSSDLANTVFTDIFNHQGDVTIDQNGDGEFRVDGGSLSIYLKK